MRPSGLLEVAVRNLPWRAAWRETRKPPYVALVSVFTSVPYGWTESRLWTGGGRVLWGGVSGDTAARAVSAEGRREFGDEAPGLRSGSHL